MLSFCLMLLGTALGLPGPLGSTDEIHEGKVLSVTATEIIVLDNKAAENDKFTVNAQTKITRDGKPAKLTDVRAGDRVKVVATQLEANLVAKSIEARSPE